MENSFNRVEGLKEIWMSQTKPQVTFVFDTKETAKACVTIISRNLPINTHTLDNQFEPRFIYLQGGPNLKQADPELSVSVEEKEFDGNPDRPTVLEIIQHVGKVLADSYSCPKHKVDIFIVK